MPFDYDDDFTSVHEPDFETEPIPEEYQEPDSDEMPYDDLEDDYDPYDEPDEEQPDAPFSTAADNPLFFNRQNPSAPVPDESVEEESVGFLKRAFYAVINVPLRAVAFIGRAFRSFLFGDAQIYSWKNERAYTNLRSDAKQKWKQEQKQHSKKKSVEEKYSEKKSQEKNQQTQSKTKEQANAKITYIEQLLKDSGLKVMLTDRDNYKITLPNGKFMILDSGRFDNEFYDKLAAVLTLTHQAGSEKLTDLDKLHGALHTCFVRYAALIHNVRPEDTETHLNAKLTVTSADIHSCIKLEREPVYHENVLSSYHVNVLYNNTIVSSFPEKDLQSMLQNPRILEEEIHPFLDEQYQASLSTDHCIQNNRQKILFHKTGDTQVSISVVNDKTHPAEQVGTFNIEAKSDIHNITQALYQHGCSDLDLVTSSKELGAEVIATTIALTVNPAMSTGFNALDNTEYEPLLDQYVSAQTPYVSVKYRPNAYEFYETSYQNRQFNEGSKIAFISSFGGIRDKHIQQMAEHLQAEAMHIRNYLSYEQEAQNTQEVVYRTLPVPASSVFQNTLEEYAVDNTINALYSQALGSPSFAMDNHNQEIDFDFTDIDNLPLVMMQEAEYEPLTETPEPEEVTQEEQTDDIEPADALELE